MNIHELENHKQRELIWIQHKIVESINKTRTLILEKII